MIDAQISTSHGEDGSREEEKDKPVHVAISNTGVDKNAVVITTSHTSLANRAVLASCRLVEKTGTARDFWMEVCVIVCVKREVFAVVVEGDGAWVDCG